eukprot:3418690-Pleurochrysis_carterae.AAC.4
MQRGGVLEQVGLLLDGEGQVGLAKPALHDAHVTPWWNVLPWPKCSFTEIRTPLSEFMSSKTLVITCTSTFWAHTREQLQRTLALCKTTLQAVTMNMSQMTGYACRLRLWFPLVRARVGLKAVRAPASERSPPPAS